MLVLPIAQPGPDDTAPVRRTARRDRGQHAGRAEPEEDPSRRQGDDVAGTREEESPIGNVTGTDHRRALATHTLKGPWPIQGRWAAGTLTAPRTAPRLLWIDSVPDGRLVGITADGEVFTATGADGKWQPAGRVPGTPAGRSGRRPGVRPRDATLGPRSRPRDTNCPALSSRRRRGWTQVIGLIARSWRGVRP